MQLHTKLFDRSKNVLFCIKVHAPERKVVGYDRMTWSCYKISDKDRGEVGWSFKFEISSRPSADVIKSSPPNIISFSKVQFI